MKKPEFIEPPVGGAVYEIRTADDPEVDLDKENGEEILWGKFVRCKVGCVTDPPATWNRRTGSAFRTRQFRWVLPYRADSWTSSPIILTP